MSYRKSKKRRTRNTTSTIQEDMHTENHSEKSNMDNNQVSSNEKVEDWDKEIDGSEITQEVTETPINEELKVEPIKSNEKQQASTNGFVRVNK
ncbi:MAG: cobalamin biosynthesis protein CobQ, partial [Cyanobacteria bacterium P01_A01_bin.68]